MDDLFKIHSSKCGMFFCIDKCMYKQGNTKLYSFTLCYDNKINLCDSLPVMEKGVPFTELAPLLLGVTTNSSSSFSVPDSRCLWT